MATIQMDLHMLARIISPLDKASILTFRRIVLQSILLFARASFQTIVTLRSVRYRGASSADFM